jgi:hypothetical protein
LVLHLQCLQRGLININEQMDNYFLRNKSK